MMAFQLTTTLSYLALASAQVIVPLNDPSLVLGGNGHYNQTLCGGAIFLPDSGDSLSLTFLGSDCQFEFISNPTADPWNITIQPDGVSLGQGSGNVIGSLVPPMNCSDREVARLSDLIKGQLYWGNHTATVLNGKWSPERYNGTGIIISGVQYYPDPLPGLPTLSSEPGSHGSRGSKKAIIGGVVGGILGLILVVIALVMVYRRSRPTNERHFGKPHLDLLSPGNLTSPGRNDEGLAGAPGEKRESAVKAPAETITILQQSPRADTTQTVGQQPAQPQEDRVSKPLPSSPSTQGILSNGSDTIEPPRHSDTQLSPQQIRLVQELMDQGLPAPQVAGVVRSMLASGSSNNTNAAVADAPPEYDFKDTSNRATT